MSEPAEWSSELFVYVRIPGNIGPLERGDRFEDPLDDCLAEDGLGHVSGGGSQLGENPDGTRCIEFCGIDVDVIDLEPALVAMRAELIALGAPLGTQLQYTANGQRLQDELRDEGWTLALPRTLLHPGFGC